MMLGIENQSTDNRYFNDGIVRSPAIHPIGDNLFSRFCGGQFQAIAGGIHQSLQAVGFLGVLLAGGNLLLGGEGAEVVGFGSDHGFGVGLAGLGDGGGAFGIGIGLAGGLRQGGDADKQQHGYGEVSHSREHHTNNAGGKNKK